jgi:GDPmannose 4,6-dehydratase
MNTKTAFITGVSGQDGSFLAKLLISEGYIVYGGLRRTDVQQLWRLDELGLIGHKNFKTVQCDVSDWSSITSFLVEIKPDEIYNLAATSFVGSSFVKPLSTNSSVGTGVLNMLEAMKQFSPNSKFYQASSSEMFGKVAETPQSESTPFYPRSPYGVSKVFGHFSTVNYREAYNLFACNGILFNHESEIRGTEFVTRKISMSVAKYKYDKNSVLLLGNLDAKRDWGYAPEYVQGMKLMLSQSTPADYVLATGKTQSVREFVCHAFASIDIEIIFEGEGLKEKGIEKKSGKTLVQVSQQFFRPSEVDILIGNPQKAKIELNWEPKIQFDQLVERMVKCDINRLNILE